MDVELVSEWKIIVEKLKNVIEKMGKGNRLFMSFVVSEKAIHSFKNDWDLEEGQYIRIYAKYAGGGSEAFSM